MNHWGIVPHDSLSLRMGWLNQISILNQIYLAILVGDIVIIVTKYSRLPENLRPVLILVFSNLLIEAISDYIKVTTNGNNLFLYHFYAPIEYSCIAALFYSTLQQHTQRNNIKISVALYTVLVLISTIYWQPLSHNNSITYMIESAFVIYWCFIFFQTILNKEDLYQPERDHTFWVVVALLIYFSGTFFTIGLIDYFIISNQTLASVIYYASFPFSFILYLTIGFVCSMPNVLSSHGE